MLGKRVRPRRWTACTAPRRSKGGRAVVCGLRLSPTASPIGAGLFERSCCGYCFNTVSEWSWNLVVKFISSKVAWRVAGAPQNVISQAGSCSAAASAPTSHLLVTRPPCKATAEISAAPSLSPRQPMPRRGLAERLQSGKFEADRPVRQYVHVHSRTGRNPKCMDSDGFTSHTDCKKSRDMRSAECCKDSASMRAGCLSLPHCAQASSIGLTFRSCTRPYLHQLRIFMIYIPVSERNPPALLVLHSHGIHYSTRSKPALQQNQAVQSLSSAATVTVTVTVTVTLTLTV